MSIRVAVAGAAGRMGRTVVRAVHGDPDLTICGALDVACLGEDAGTLAGVGVVGIAISDSASSMLEDSRADVLVDFTRASAAYQNAVAALKLGVSPVIGTTGMPAEQVVELARLSEEHGTGCFMAPNFAIGAVLMMLFARQAARYMPEVEVIEFHGEQKIDAPSGTAMRTLDFIHEGRAARTAVRPEREEFKLPGARGGDSDGVRVHSVRLPGYVAHQECLFGGLGQTLTIRHDSTDRVSFMPGVLLACKQVRGLKRLVVGLEHLLEL